MTEIESIEKYMFICDKDGNKSHIKLNETQKRFLEYIRNKSSFFSKECCITIIKKLITT